MVQVTILGAAGVVPAASQESTSLAIQSQGLSALIDCTGSPLLKLQQIGMDPQALDAVILTHRHPDHLYGLPALIQGLGMIGLVRGAPLRTLQIFGSQDVLEVVQALIRVFELEEDLADIPLDLQEIPLVAEHLLLERQDIAIWTTPVEHFVPTVAIKIQDKHSGHALTYSSDTNPCEPLIQFATGSTILLHECNLPAGKTGRGHTNCKQAGQVARLAQVQKLVLVHLPVFHYDISSFPQEAQGEFAGPIEIPDPLATYTL